MVAKSYQNLEILSEPFTSSGRQYVTVRTKAGTTKNVRWYTEREYLKMYPDEASTTSVSTQKEALGFTKGYVTIFKGNTYEEMDYFKTNSARYNRVYGWYFISDDPIPDDLPEDVIPITLPWELVGNPDGTCKPEEEMRKAVETLIYAVDDPGEFVGSVGDSLELVLTVTSVYDMDGYYGTQRMHIFSDENSNTFVWTTSAKSWDVDTVHHVRAKVKAHKTYKGRNQTIINYVKEI